jgi:hypothetical protein
MIMERSKADNSVGGGVEGCIEHLGQLLAHSLILSVVGTWLEKREDSWRTKQEPGHPGLVKSHEGFCTLS